MSAARYGLTMLSGPGTTYEPREKERADAEVTVTCWNQTKNQAR